MKGNISVGLSTIEVGALLGITGKTIRVWCNQGKIKHTKTTLGRRKIPLSEVERLQKELGVK